MFRTAATIARILLSLWNEVQRVARRQPSPLIISVFLIFALTSCIFTRQQPNPIKQAIDRWGKSAKNYSPKNSTLLLAFDIHSCISCGSFAIKLLQQKIQKYNLAANLLIVIAVDQPGESKAALPKNFHDLVAEDTNQTLKKVFSVELFPTLLIVNSRGQIRHTIVDPVHNFPDDATLLRYLSPSPIGLVPEERLLLPQSPGTLLIEASNTGNAPELPFVYIVDSKQNAIFTIDPIAAKLVKLWKASDSIRFHPDYQARFDIDISDWWQQFREQSPIPFAMLEAIVYCSSSEVAVLAYLLTRIAEGGASQVPVLLLFSTQPSFQLRAIKYLPNIPGERYTLQKFGEYLIAFSSQPDSVKLYALQASDSSEIREIADFEQDTTLPSLIQTRVYNAPEFSLRRNAALVFYLKLPSLVYLRFPHNSLDSLITKTFPYTKALQGYRFAQFRVFLDAYDEIQRLLTRMHRESTPIYLSSSLFLHSLNDTTWILAAKYNKTPKAEHSLSLLLQWYTPSGLTKERIYILTFPKIDKEDQRRSWRILTYQNRLYLLIKWRKKGWCIYSIPKDSLLSTNVK